MLSYIVNGTWFIIWGELVIVGLFTRCAHGRMGKNEILNNILKGTWYLICRIFFECTFFFWMWCKILNVRTNYIVNIWKNALFYLVFVIHFGIEKNWSFRFFRSMHGFTQICTKENTTECKCTKTWTENHTTCDVIFWI